MTGAKLPEGLSEFLSACGWEGAQVIPLVADASFRRYFRISGHGGRKAMLMDAPPPHEDPRPFLHVADYLLEHGFRAPQIFGKDLDRGLILIEDFGDRRMREHVDANPADELVVYSNAIDTLVRLARAPVAELAPYDGAVYLRETGLLSEWYMPAMGLSVEQSDYDALWREALEPLLGSDWQQTTVLRDYHAENVMLLDDGTQGLIDFQDALAGHPAYDLVSLLQDARRDVSPNLETAMIARYKATAAVDYDFGLHYALLGAQRNAKIIGIFTRLWKRDGKARYLGFLPRMWGLLERDLEHPGLARLKRWFDTEVPHHIRAASPDSVA